MNFLNLFKSGKVPKINCSIKFMEKDILTGFSNEKYDLVVDWMCFHELPPNDRRSYVEIINDVCSNSVVVTVFHKDDNYSFQPTEFRDVAGKIKKYRFTAEELSNCFAPHFSRLPQMDKTYPPIDKEIHTDGKVFPKLSAYMAKNT